MSKTKPFPLFDGDVVQFQSNNGVKQGTLIKRPYGRRLYAVVKDDRGVLHYVPTRDRIVGKVDG